MGALLDRMIERFPDFKTALHKTTEIEKNLGELFNEFENVEGRLSKFDGAGGSSNFAEHDRLRHRRALLEEQMLTMMQHFGRK